MSCTRGYQNKKFRTKNTLRHQDGLSVCQVVRRRSMTRWSYAQTLLWYSPFSEGNLAGRHLLWRGIWRGCREGIWRKPTATYVFGDHHQYAMPCTLMVPAAIKSFMRTCKVLQIPNNLYFYFILVLYSGSGLEIFFFFVFFVLSLAD